MKNLDFQKTLGRLQRRVRGIAAFSGLGWGSLAAFLTVLCGGWADLVFELSPALRLAALAAAVLLGPALAIFVAWRSGRLAVPSVLARRLDQAGAARGEIIAGVDLLHDSRVFAPPAAGLASIAVERAANLARQVPGARVAPWRPVLRATLATGLAAGVVALLAVALPRMADTLWQRFSDPYGDHPPYSAVRFRVEPGDLSVVYGQGVEIRAIVEGAPVDRLDLVLEPAGAAPEQRAHVSRSQRPLAGGPRKRDRAGPLLRERRRGAGSKLASQDRRHHRAAAQCRPLPRHSAGIHAAGLPTKVCCPPAGWRGWPAPMSRPGPPATARSCPERSSSQAPPLHAHSSSSRPPRSRRKSTAPSRFGPTARSRSGCATQTASSRRMPCRLPSSCSMTSGRSSGSPSPASSPSPRPTSCCPSSSPPRTILESPGSSSSCALNGSRALPIDLPLGSGSPTQWNDQTYLPLAEYGVRPGDEITLFARVEDNDPAGERVRKHRGPASDHPS